MVLFYTVFFFIVLLFYFILYIKSTAVCIQAEIR